MELDQTLKEHPKLIVDSVAVKINNLEVKISGSAASLIYNLLLSSSNSMKNKLQEELQKAMATFFQVQTKNTITNYVKTM